MSKTKAGPISADRLKSFIERVERLEEERKAIGGDIRDVYSEAKGVGYDVKTMRKIVQLRRIDVAERDEQEQLLDVYAHALGMVIGGSGVTVTTVAREPTDEELEERASRIVNEVERCMALVQGDALPKIEAIKDLIGCSNGKAHKLRRLVEAWISRINDDDRENPEITTEARHLRDGGKGTPVTSRAGSVAVTNSDAAPVKGVSQEAVPAPPQPAPEDWGRAGTHQEEGEGESCGPGLSTGLGAPVDSGFLDGRATRRLDPSHVANAACPSTPPQPDDCSTGVVVARGYYRDGVASAAELTVALGAVAEPEAERVARPDIFAESANNSELIGDDLTLPDFLDRRREIESRRAAT